MESLNGIEQADMDGKAKKLRNIRLQCDWVAFLKLLYVSNREEYKVALTGFYYHLHLTKFWNCLKYMSKLRGKHQNTLTHEVKYIHHHS